MRNMIFKTLFASILGSLLVATSAHADRQGGGTLKVAFNAMNANAVEWVRFRGTEADRLTFDYCWFSDGEKRIESVILKKTELTAQSLELIKALSESKSTSGWTRINER